MNLQEEATQKLINIFEATLKDFREVVAEELNQVDKKDELAVRGMTRGLFDRAIDVANKHTPRDQEELMYFYTSLQQALDESYTDYISKHGYDHSGNKIIENIAYSIFNLLNVNLQENFPQIIHEELAKITV